MKFARLLSTLRNALFWSEWPFTSTKVRVGDPLPMHTILKHRSPHHGLAVRTTDSAVSNQSCRRCNKQQSFIPFWQSQWSAHSNQQSWWVVSQSATFDRERGGDSSMATSSDRFCLGKECCSHLPHAIFSHSGNNNSSQSAYLIVIFDFVWGFVVSGFWISIVLKAGIAWGRCRV